MKSPRQLYDDFKKMPLSKQTAISVATIAGVVAFIANYKTIKEGTKSFVNKFSKDENVTEFLGDVEGAVKGFTNVAKSFFNGEETNQGE